MASNHGRPKGRKRRMTRQDRQKLGRKRAHERKLAQMDPEQKQRLDQQRAWW